MKFETKAIFIIKLKKQKSFGENTNYPGNYRYGSFRTRIALKKTIAGPRRPVKQSWKLITDYVNQILGTMTDP